MHWSLGMKTDVGDGSIPLEPKVMKPLLLDSSAPLCILFVWDAIFKYLRKDMIQRTCWQVPKDRKGIPHSQPENIYTNLECIILSLFFLTTFLNKKT